METQKLESVKEIIEGAVGGRASNIIVAQDRRAFDAEFAGHETLFHDIKDEAYAHTNHFLHTPHSPALDKADTMNSMTRHKTAVKAFEDLEHFSSQEMISILSDQSNGDDSILAHYKPDAQLEMGNCGTLATIVMDLGRRTMKVRCGNPSSPFFTIDHFEVYELE